MDHELLGGDDEPLVARLGQAIAGHDRRSGVSLRAPGGHSRVTHSRNQADTRGHRRTRKRSDSSTGGTARTPQDTRGHGIAPVRDREAPGSNPGPPTIFELEIEDFAACLGGPFAHRVLRLSSYVRADGSAGSPRVLRTL